MGDLRTVASLPDHLAARVHPVVPGSEHTAPSPDGRFVLYWMRAAARGHDNPALDVAAHTAAGLGLPFFVYHGLSERYPYASDRHHRFILEGARDVARELAERGVGYAFHLERPGHRGPHLTTLAARAALVVTEDVPVRPLDRWTEALARAVAGVPVWAVDTNCLAPMRQTSRPSTTRAFRFRSATQAARRRWLAEPWPDAELPGEPFLPELPFRPVFVHDATDAELADLVASCAIDHGVAPVPHTRGGSRAGYARWSDFRDRRLAAYAKARNDALRPGVSRMSAYLHHGHVSPFRIAREAAAAGGPGADKYLDELLVWRELAWAFCAHHPDHDTVAGIPGWARETLADHAGDDRRVLSWERMARGRTGDALWDAAQRSLTIHGELHNNVRMTWGKAIVGWTPDAERALARTVDLNHRYALDGRDPASFGGILWCLGQFDRPFSPQAPVFGAVRPRSTRHHARRLDTDAYARRTGRPAWEGAPRVAVVGAGPSGLMAARTLQDHGLEVRVFDKGRRPGGRANTRETRGPDDHRFDHGAQYFTARDASTRRLVEAWADEGVVAEWTGRLVRMDGDVVEPAKPAVRWVGVPGMVDLAAHLAADLDVRCGVRIVEVRPAASRAAAAAAQADLWAEAEAADPVGAAADTPAWRLVDADGALHGPFDRVVVAVPAPQAVPLLTPVPELAAAAAAVDMVPCWAGMLAFDGPLDPGFDGAFLRDGPFSWMARDSSKPGRPDGERWVVHATAAWTRAHMDRPPAAIVDLMVEALAARFGPLPARVSGTAHRWGYARTADAASGGDEAAAPPGHLFDPATGMGVCGDWLNGGRVEGALLSGVAVAGRILGRAGV